MRIIPALASLALLAACNQSGPEPSPSEQETVAASPTPDPSVARDAMVVARQWQAAMEARDWAKVRGFWGDHGQASGMTPAQFAEAWGVLKTVHVRFGTGLTDAGAGSVFFELPVSVDGVKQDGLAYRTEGVLSWRRVNDVPGATPEQLRWHIERSTLAPSS